MPFAQRLTDLMKKYNIKGNKLAKVMNISSSYVTKLTKPYKPKEEDEHKPKSSPHLSQSNMFKLVGALRTFKVPDSEIAYLVESAGNSWAKFQNPPNNILEILATTKPSPHPQPSSKDNKQNQNTLDIEIPHPNNSEVTVSEFLKQAKLLLKEINFNNHNDQTQNIYILTSLKPNNTDQANYEEFLKTIIECFAKAGAKGKKLEVFHLLCANHNNIFTSFNNIFSNCLTVCGYNLYSLIPESQLLPEIIATDQMSLLIGLPTKTDTDNNPISYTINKLSSEDRKEDIQTYIKYIEYLKNKAGDKQLLVKTYPSYTGNHNFGQITLELISAEQEEENKKTERFVLKEVFSSIFRSEDMLRHRFAAENNKNITTTKIEQYIDAHNKRTTFLQSELNNRVEKHIYNQKALEKHFKDMAEAFCNTQTPITNEIEKDQAIAKLLFDQTITITNTLTNQPNLNIALERHDLRQHSFTITLLKTHAFLVSKPINNKDLGEPIIAATIQHTDLIQQMREEFKERWEKIQLKSDSPENRRNVIEWIITSVLNSLIKAEILKTKVLKEKFFLLAQRIIAANLNQTIDTFYEELLYHEQQSKSILIVTKYFPRCTLPPNTDKKFKRDTLNMRRLALPHLFLDPSRKFDIVMTKGDINNYWKTGQYNRGENRKQFIEQDHKNICLFLEKHAENVSMHIIDDDSTLPISFQVVDKKTTFFKMDNAIKNKLGIILHNQNLSEALYSNFTKLMPKNTDNQLIKPKEAIGWIKNSIKNK